MRDRLLAIVWRLQAKRELPRALLQSDSSLKDPAEDIVAAFLADPLVCAAPDLLEACKELIAALNEPDEALRRSWLIDAHNKAGAAITKAEKPQ